MATNIARFDQLRVIGFASISGTYAAVGTPLGHQARIICLTNNTDADMLVSVDTVNDNLIVPAGGFKLFDFTTNKSDNSHTMVIVPNTQFYVKQISAPSSGNFYIEIIYSAGE